MMKCINNISTNPYFNLAAEEYLMSQFDDNIFMLWRNEPSIIIGKYQNTLAEINIDYVRSHQIKVVRRMTGGGAVFHDLGNLNYTFIDNDVSMNFRLFSEPILEVLRDLGVDARFEGRNDLTISGLKFSGNAQCVHKQRKLHHGTLLFSAMMSDLSAALKVNPLKFSDKAVKSVAKRVTNISEHLPTPLTVTAFRDLIMNYIFQTRSDAVLYSFTEYDLKQIENLMNEKYVNWDWNYGASPHFSFSQLHRTSGGNIEVNLNVEHGMIAAIKFYGDFFACKDMTEFENSLLNVPYREADIRERLEQIRYQDYIVNVSLDELVALFGAL